MAREEGHEVCGDADGAHPGAAAAVGNAKRFVQIEVADVGADVAGGGEADLGVHVGPVHVDLAAVRVDRGADVFDRGLEDAVRRRVGDHERGEIVGVRGGFRGEVGDVDVALGIAGDGHDGEAAHRGAGRVGAVGTGRNQTDVAVALAARLVVGADDEQAGVFTLGSGIGLKGNAGKTGDVGQPGLKIFEKLGVAAGLFGRREGVEFAEFGP